MIDADMVHFHALGERAVINALVATLVLNGCLMRQTVTSGGEVVKDGYVVKRPLKDALQSAK